MSLYSQLADEIAGHGIVDVFGIPGSGPSLDLIDELEKRSIRFHLNQFEGASAIMAGVTGRLTSRAGVAISIKGPGLSNMVPGLAICRFESLPMVAICEAYAPDVLLSKAHKRLDHGTLTKALVKGRRYISQRGPKFGEVAAWAEDEVPAPVLFEATGRPDPVEDIEPIHLTAGREDGATYAHLIKNSQRPVIIAGTLAIRQALSPVLNRMEVPVFSTAAAKGVVDESLPHAAGVYTGVGSEYVPEKVVFDRADLVIGIGLRPSEVLNANPFHCPSINIDAFDDKIASDAFKFSASPDVTKGKEILNSLEGKAWGVQELHLCLKKLRRYMLEKTFLPAHVYETIEMSLGLNVRMVLDTGNFCTIGEHIWRSPRPNLYLSSGQGRYMGASLPMGIGACIHDDGIPCLVVVGDGGIGPFVSELKLAVRYQLPMVVLLLSDGMFGSIRGRALRDGLTQNPLTIEDPHWVSIMEGFRINAVRVEDQQSLTDVLKRWSSTRGPLFIEIPFNPDDYLSMTEGIR